MVPSHSTLPRRCEAEARAALPAMLAMCGLGALLGWTVDIRYMPKAPDGEIREPLELFEHLVISADHAMPIRTWRRH